MLQIQALHGFAIMLIKKNDARRVENSSKCIVWEYALPSKKFGFATALIDGRHP